MNALQPGLVQTLFDAVTNGAQNSTAYALPARASQVTWQSSFGTAPASVTLQLQTSLDNLVWSTIDTSTSTAGESRTIATSAIFVRVRENAVSGGSTTTVNIVAKSGIIGSADLDVTDLTVNGNLTVTGDTSLVGTLTGTNAIFDSFAAAELTYPLTDGSDGQVIGTDGAGNLAFIDAASPGAPDNSIQFNNSGVFAGDSDLTWDAASKGIVLDRANNLYGFWFDDSSQNDFGIFRIRNKNQQASPVGYNPLYPKYTPDASAFERWVLQWNISDTYNPLIEIGSEWGATVSGIHISRSSSTATVQQTGHGYRTGDIILIAGANQTEYNGNQTITVIDDDFYTYTVSGTPASPATGTITATGGSARPVNLTGGDITLMDNIYIAGANHPWLFTMTTKDGSNPIAKLGDDYWNDLIFDLYDGGAIYSSNAFLRIGIVDHPFFTALFSSSVTAGSFIGPVVFPTSDPMIVGAWWNNSGVLTISAA